MSKIGEFDFCFGKKTGGTLEAEIREDWKIVGEVLPFGIPTPLRVTAFSELDSDRLEGITCGLPG